MSDENPLSRKDPSLGRVRAAAAGKLGSGKVASKVASKLKNTNGTSKAKAGGKAPRPAGSGLGQRRPKPKQSTGSKVKAGAKTAGVTAAKVAAGNYVGAGIEVLKNKQARKGIIIAGVSVFALQMLVFMLLISLIGIIPAVVGGGPSAVAGKVVDSIVGVFKSNDAGAGEVDVKDRNMAAEVVNGARAAAGEGDVPWQVLAATELVMYDFEPAPDGKAPYKIKADKTDNNDKYPWGKLSDDEVKNRETSGRWLVKAIIAEFGTGRGGTSSSGSLDGGGGGGGGADAKAFFEKYADMAKASEKEHDVPASVTLAQAALESAWGKSTLAANDHNFFGIKCGGSANCNNYQTREGGAGGPIIEAGFRVYDSDEDSFLDHAKLLAVDNPVYGPAFETDNADDFARALQDVGYATDPDYANKLIKMMEDNDLYKYNESGDKTRKPTPKTYANGGGGTNGGGSGLKGGDASGGYLASDLLAGAVEIEDPDGNRRMGIDETMSGSKPVHEQVKNAYKSVLSAMPIDGMNRTKAGQIFDLAFQISVGVNPCDRAATKKGSGNITFTEYTGAWVENAEDAKQMDTSDGTEPYANELRNYIFRAWPQIKTIYGWRHADGYNEHSTGRALDVMIDYAGSFDTDLGNEIFGWVKLNAKAINLKHVIWQQKVWFPGLDMASAGNQMEDRGSPNENHMNHLHIFLEPGEGNYDFSKPPKPTSGAASGYVAPQSYGSKKANAADDGSGKATSSADGRRSDGGWDLVDPATGGTVSLSAKQVKYLGALVDVVRSSDQIPVAHRNTAISAAAAGMWVASGLRNLSCKDTPGGDSGDGEGNCSPTTRLGVFQMSPTWGLAGDLMNPNTSIRRFLGLDTPNASKEAYAKGMMHQIKGWESTDPGEIAQKILLSGTAEAYGRAVDLLDPVLSDISGIDMRTGAVIDKEKATDPGNPDAGDSKPQARGSSKSAVGLRCSLDAKKKGGSGIGLDDGPATFAPDQISDRGFRTPTEGIRTSPFGPRVNPVTGGSELHDGMDIAASGDGCGKPIWAAYEGTVISAQMETGYGNHIMIDHGDIDGVHVVTGYAHIVDGGFRVQAGDRVSAGEQIASVGTTGWSTGCHLHFQVKENGQFVNPASWLGGLRSIQ